jgi:ABC-2 type transport system permease protein
MEATIEVAGLRKRFGSVLALDGMSFTVQPGQVTGFVGPNGAGKSTTMRVILGLDAADDGTALIGAKPYAGLRHPLNHVGALLDAAALQPSRTARNHLLWLAHSQGLTSKRRAGRGRVPAAPTGRMIEGSRRRAGYSALHAEWTKLRTLASTGWLLLGVVALTVGVSAATTAAATCPSGGGCQPDPAKISLTGVQAGQALVAILAVLAISNEYSTGMIRVTLTAMPRRWSVLGAKAALIGGLVLAAGALGVLGSVLAGRLILPGRGFTAAHGYLPLSLGDGPVLRAACGSVLYLALIALLSLGVATAVRDSAVAIGVVLALLYMFPLVTAVVTKPTWQRHLEQISPVTAGLYIQATVGVKSLPLTPWQGLGVLAAWAFGALLLGALVLRLRDA